MRRGLAAIGGVIGQVGAGRLGSRSRLGSKAGRGDAGPEFTPRERELLRPRERVGLAEWADRHRYVTQGPLIGPAGAPIRWSNETFPLQRAIMEAIEDPRFSRVVVMGPPQAGGKTDCAAINPILKALHHDRRDALYMSANALKAHDQWVKKFAPAIAASPELAALIPVDREDGGTRDRRDFANGCSLFLAGAESVANLSGSTIPVVVCDDVQAMARSLGAMGHAVDVAFKRSAALPEDERMHVLLGTAGTVEDYLWRTLVRSTHFRPYLPCPACGTYQLLEWERMVFPPDDPARALTECHMRCANEGCDHPINDHELPAMLRAVEWVGRDGQVPDPLPHGRGSVRGRGSDQGRGSDRSLTLDIAARRKGQAVAARFGRGSVRDRQPPTGDGPSGTRVAGFWWNAFYWPFTSWGSLAAEWIDARGDPERERNFRQDVLVIPHEEPEEDVDAATVEQMAEHRLEGHRKGIVPAGADLVTLTADVHDRFLYYIVRAWRRATGTSWLVDAGTLGVHGPRKGEELDESEHRARIGHAIRETLDDLWAMEREGWPVEGVEGRKMHAEAALIDGGYRPDAVGQFCLRRNAGLRRRIWHMIRGRSELKGARAIWPKRVFRNKRGHVYREINVDEAKHLLRELLAIPRDRDGAWHTYVDVPLEAYHRHMVSEHFVAKMRGGREIKVWEKRSGAGPNHWWDDEVYQIAAALCRGVKLPSVHGAAVPRTVKQFFKAAAR